MHRDIQGKPLNSGCCFEGILTFQRSCSPEPGFLSVSVLPRHSASVPVTSVPRAGDDVFFSHVNIFHLHHTEGQGSDSSFHFRICSRWLTASSPLERLGILSGQLRHPALGRSHASPGPGEHRLHDPPRANAAPPGGRAESGAGRDHPANLPSCLLTPRTPHSPQGRQQAGNRARSGRDRPRFSRPRLPTAHPASESPKE